eukprot:1145963-Pelagomonas_calceolata.AAC.10
MVGVEGVAGIIGHQVFAIKVAIAFNGTLNGVYHKLICTRKLEDQGIFKALCIASPTYTQEIGVEEDIAPSQMVAVSFVLVVVTLNDFRAVQELVLPFKLPPRIALGLIYCMQ